MDCSPGGGVIMLNTLQYGLQIKNERVARQIVETLKEKGIVRKNPYTSFPLFFEAAITDLGVAMAALDTPVASTNPQPLHGPMELIQPISNTALDDVTKATAAEPVLQESIDEKEALVQDILDDGGFKLEMSFDRNGYNVKSHRMLEEGYSTKGLVPRAGYGMIDKRQLEGLSKENVFIDRNLFADAIFEWVTIPGKKGGLFGIGKTPDTGYSREIRHERSLLHSEFVKNGKKEPAVHIHYNIPPEKIAWGVPDGRNGQYLGFVMTLPASVADRLEKILETDPKFIRTVVGKVMSETFGLAEQMVPSRTKSGCLTPPIWIDGQHSEMGIKKGRGDAEIVKI